MTASSFMSNTRTHMTPRRFITLGILASILGGCSAPPMRPLEFAPLVRLQDPLPGRAIVYLIRAPHDGAEIAVRASETLLAVLPRGTYTAISLPPGIYRISSTTLSTSTLLGSAESSAPLELAVSADQRRFFYLSQPRSTSDSLTLLPIGGGVLPALSHTSAPSGPRSWKEATEREAQDLMTISKLALPEKNAF
jgi:hypothetical protein